MFSVLDDIAAGDVLGLRFNNTAEVADAAYLLFMIEDGILTSPDQIVLIAICESEFWGEGGRQFTVVVTDTFDRSRFESRMRRRLDLLQVVERKTPLVDIDALEAAIGIFQLRLKPDGFDAIPALHDLGEMEVVQFIDWSVFERLGDAYSAGAWASDDNRSFCIVSMISTNGVDYWLYFREHVLPHLELLRRDEER